MTVLEAIKRCGIVPVVIVDTPAQALKLAHILQTCHIGVIEITLRTEAALSCIEALRKAFPAMVIGAGTILTTNDLDRVISAGADFGVAPGCNATVATHALEKSFSFIPGVMTPSEIEHAVSMGFKTLKFFPAEHAGGINFLKAIYAPYARLGISFMPTGGITPHNVSSYLSEEMICAVGGSWFVNKKEVTEGNWGTIEKSCREARVLVDSCRNI